MRCVPKMFRTLGNPDADGDGSGMEMFREGRTDCPLDIGDVEGAGTPTTNKCVRFSRAAVCLSMASAIRLVDVSMRVMSLSRFLVAWST